MSNGTDAPIFSIELDGYAIPVYAADASSPVDAANRVTRRAFDALTRAHSSTGLIDPVLLGAKWASSGEPSSPLAEQPTTEYAPEPVGKE